MVHLSTLLLMIYLYINFTRRDLHQIFQLDSFCQSHRGALSLFYRWFLLALIESQGLWKWSELGELTTCKAQVVFCFSLQYKDKANNNIPCSTSILSCKCWCLLVPLNNLLFKWNFWHFQFWGFMPSLTPTKYLNCIFKYVQTFRISLMS